MKDGKTVETLALVDSGADDCLFPASLATSLGITIPNQRSYVFSGTIQEPQLAFFEKIEIGIWDSRASAIAFTFGLDAGFCPTLEHTGCGLLGQNGFFSRFKVTIDHANRYFDIDETSA